MSKDNSKRLFDSLVKHGYEFGDNNSFEEFESIMADSAKARAVYNQAKNDGYKFDAFEKFYKDFGTEQKEEPKADVSAANDSVQSADAYDNAWQNGSVSEPAAVEQKPDVTVVNNDTANTQPVQTKQLADSSANVQQPNPKDFNAEQALANIRQAQNDSANAANGTAPIDSSAMEQAVDAMVNSERGQQALANLNAMLAYKAKEKADDDDFWNNHAKAHFENAAKEEREREMRRQNAWTENGVSLNNRNITGELVKRAADMRGISPTDAINETLSRLDDSGEMTDYINKRLGISANTSTDEEQSQELTDEEKKTFNERYSGEFDRIADMLQDKIFDEYRASGAPRNVLEYIIGEGFKNSLVGTIGNIAINGASKDGALREQLRQQGVAQYEQNVGSVVQGVKGAATMVFDAPAFTVGGKLGEGIASGVTKAVAKRMFGEAAADAGVRYLMTKQAMQMLNGAIRSSQAFGVYGGMSGSLNSIGNIETTDENGNPLSMAQIIGNIALQTGKSYLEESAKGALIGAAGQGIRLGSGRIADNFGYYGTKKKLMEDFAGFTGNLGVFTGMEAAEAAINGTYGEFDWGSSLIRNAAMFAVMDYNPAKWGDVIKRYKENTPDCKLTDEELDAIDKAGYGKIKESVIRDVVSDMKSRQSNPESVDQSIYFKMLTDDNIPINAKRKLRYIFEGVRMSEADNPKVFSVRLESEDNGRWNVITYNENGKIIENHSVANQSAAERYAAELQQQAVKNNIESAEMMVMSSVKDGRSPEDVIAGIQSEIDGLHKDAEPIENLLKKDAKKYTEKEMQKVQSYMQRLQEEFRNQNVDPRQRKIEDATGQDGQIHIGLVSDGRTVFVKDETPETDAVVIFDAETGEKGMAKRSSIEPVGEMSAEDVLRDEIETYDPVKGAQVGNIVWIPEEKGGRITGWKQCHVRSIGEDGVWVSEDGKTMTIIKPTNLAEFQKMHDDAETAEQEAAAVQEQLDTENKQANPEIRDIDGTRYTYESENGNVVISRDGNGNKKAFTYDEWENGRLVDVKAEEEEAARQAAEEKAKADEETRAKAEAERKSREEKEQRERAEREAKEREEAAAKTEAERAAIEKRKAGSVQEGKEDSHSDVYKELLERARKGIEPTTAKSLVSKLSDQELVKLEQYLDEADKYSWWVDEFEKRESELNKVGSTGTGEFGPIYEDFQDRVKDAFRFLILHEDGDMIGVFRRRDVGRIDLVWGDERGGLAHIIDKHIGDGKSFANIDEAIREIKNIIDNGIPDPKNNNGEKVVLKIGNKQVTIRKNVRENGKKIADKNWVLTAYDEDAADGGSAVTTKKLGPATRATATSTDKDTEKSASNQENVEKNAENDVTSGESAKPKEQNKKPKKAGKEGTVKTETGNGTAEHEPTKDEEKQIRSMSFSQIQELSHKRDGGELKAAVETIRNRDSAKVNEALDVIRKAFDDKSAYNISQCESVAASALSDANIHPFVLGEAYRDVVRQLKNVGKNKDEKNALTIMERALRHEIDVNAFDSFEQMANISPDVFVMKDRAGDKHFYYDSKDSGQKNYMLVAVGQGYIEPGKPSAKKFDIAEAIDTDEIRIPLRGVYHENGLEIATDARILVVKKASYPEELEGKITVPDPTNKKWAKVDGIGKGGVVEGKYPNWKRAIPNYDEENSVSFTDLDGLQAFVAGIKKRDGFAKREVRFVCVKFGEGKIAWFSSGTLEIFLRAAKDAGAKEIRISKDSTRVCAYKNGDNVGLLMPFGGLDEFYDLGNKYAYIPEDVWGVNNGEHDGKFGHGMENDASPNDIRANEQTEGRTSDEKSEEKTPNGKPESNAQQNGATEEEYTEADTEHEKAKAKVSKPFAKFVEGLSDEELEKERENQETLASQEKRSYEEHKKEHEELVAKYESVKKSIDDIRKAFADKASALSEKLLGGEVDKETEKKVSKLEEVADESSDRRTLMLRASSMSDYIYDVLDAQSAIKYMVDVIDDEVLDDVRTQIENADDMWFNLKDLVDTIREADNEDKDDCANDLREYINEITSGDEKDLRKSLMVIERLESMEDDINDVFDALNEKNDTETLLEDGEAEIKDSGEWLAELKDRAKNPDELNFVNAEIKRRKKHLPKTKDGAAEVPQQVEETAKNGEEETEKNEEENGKTEAKEEESKAPVKKIEDVGEKIGNARKDATLNYAKKIDVDADTPSKIFPKPNFASMEKAGVPHETLVKLKAYHTIVEQDGKSKRKRKKADVLMAARFYGAAAKDMLMRDVDVYNEAKDGLVLTDYGKQHLRVLTDCIEALDKSGRTDLFDLDLSDVSVNVGNFAKADNGYYRDSDGHGWAITGKPNDETLVVVGNGAFEKDVYRLDDKEGWTKRYCEEVEKAHSKSVRDEIKFYVYYNNSGNVWIEAKVKGVSEAFRMKDGFKSHKDAYAYIKENDAALRAEAKAKADEAKMGRGGSGKSVSNDDIERALRDIATEERIGKDYRGGKSVSAEDFMNTFGFRGVEFGNWASQKERQQHLDNCYDALMDLADLIGVSPKALSLGGKLGFAFGSRGHSKALAHYEPAKHVINLTKKHGAGCVAHEWFHALDNYFGGGAFQLNSLMATEGHKTDGMRDEMHELFDRLRNKLSMSGMHGRSLTLDGAKDAYWSTTKEMAARAFETYVNERLMERGQKNQYLSAHVPGENAKIESIAKNDPYPTAEESKKFCEVFDKMFGTIQERTDESGNQVMFMKAGAPTVNNVRNEVERFLNPDAASIPERKDRTLHDNINDEVGLFDAANIDDIERSERAIEKGLSGAFYTYYDGMNFAEHPDIPEAVKDAFADAEYDYKDIPSVLKRKIKDADEWGDPSDKDELSEALFWYNAHKGELALAPMEFFDDGGNYIGSPENKLNRRSGESIAEYAKRVNDYNLAADKRNEEKLNDAVNGIIEATAPESATEAEKAAAKAAVLGVANAIGRKNVVFEQQEGAAERALREEKMMSTELDEQYPGWQEVQVTKKGGHSTQITGTTTTYRKIGEHLIEEMGEDAKKLDILDASSGKGLGTLAMREMGLNVEDVEPFPASDRKEQPTYTNYADIKKKYDVVVSNAVLNVIPDDWRDGVLANMANMVKDGGRMIINTRGLSEVKGIKHKTELDDASEVLTSTSYQKFYSHETLTDYIRHQLGDGWKIENANKANAGFGNEQAVVVTKGEGAKAPELMKKSDGQVYGWFSPDGKVHLTPNGVNGNTPLHEYGHSYALAMEHSNPKLWTRVKELLSQLTDIADFVKKNYQELDGDAMYREMFARYIGNEGSKHLEEDARKAMNEKNDWKEKGFVANLFGKLRQALEAAKKWIVTNVLKLDPKHFKTMDDVLDKTLFDLANGFDPNPHGPKGSKPRENEAMVGGKPESGGAEFINYIRDVQDKLSAIKDAGDIKKLGKATADFVKENISAGMANKMGARRIKALVNQLNAATTRDELNRPVMTLMQITNDAEVDNQVSSMSRLITKKLRSIDHRGVAKGIEVDPETALVMQRIRSAFKNAMATEVDERLKDARKEVRELKAQAVGLAGVKHYSEITKAMRGSNAELDSKCADIDTKSADVASIEAEQEELQHANQHDEIDNVNAEMSRIERDINDGKELTDEQKRLYDIVLPMRLEIAKARRLMDNGNVEIEEGTDQYSLAYYQRQLSKLIKEANEIMPDEERPATLDGVSDEDRSKWKEYDRLMAEADNVQTQVIIAQGDLIRMVSGINEKLGDLLGEGRSIFKLMREVERERKSRICGMALSCTRWKDAPLEGDRATEKDASILEKFQNAIDKPLQSLEYMCNLIDVNHYANKGPLYEYFIHDAQTGIAAAQAKYGDRMLQYGETFKKELKEIFGDKFTEKDLQNMLNEELGKPITRLVSKEDQRKSARNNRGVSVVGKEGDEYKIEHKTKDNALFLWCAWQQPDGRAKMKASGYTQSSIEQIEDILGDKLISLAKWVTDEFYPELRKEYDKTYVELFGTHLAENPHYFPLNISRAAIPERGELGKRNDFSNASIVAPNIIERTHNLLPLDEYASFLQIFQNYGKNMEQWNAMSRIIRDLNTLRANRMFKENLEANAKGLFNRFFNAAEVATWSTYQRDEDTVNDFVNKLITAKGISAIGFRFATALRQTLSYTGYLFYMKDKQFLADLTDNAMLTDKWYDNYKWCIDNVPSFRSRVSTGDMGLEGLNDKTFFDSFVRKYREAGLAPNRFIDTLTISAGAKAVYDQSMRIYKKQGMPDELAHAQAIVDTEIAFNTTQQSSEPWVSSPMQKSGSAWHRSLTLFQNSAISYQRKARMAEIQIVRAAHLRDENVKRLVEGGMNEHAAKKKANAEALRSIAGSIASIANVALLGGLWALGSNTNILFNWNEDKWSDLKKALWLGVFIQGTTYGSAINTIANGYSWTPMPFLDEVLDTTKTLFETEDIKDVLNTETTVKLLDYVAKMGLGLDMQTWSNILHGIINHGDEVAKFDKGDWIDWYLFLNASKADREELAKYLYANEGPVNFARNYERAWANADKKRGVAEFTRSIIKSDATELTSSQVGRIVNGYIQSKDIDFFEDMEEYGKKEKSLQKQYDMFVHDGGGGNPFNNDDELVKYLKEHPEMHDINEAYGIVKLYIRSIVVDMKDKSKTKDVTEEQMQNASIKVDEMVGRLIEAWRKSKQAQESAEE